MATFRISLSLGNIMSCWSWCHLCSDALTTCQVRKDYPSSFGLRCCKVILSSWWMVRWTGAWASFKTHTFSENKQFNLGCREVGGIHTPSLDQSAFQIRKRITWDKALISGDDSVKEAPQCHDLRLALGGTVLDL